MCRRFILVYCLLVVWANGLAQDSSAEIPQKDLVDVFLKLLKIRVTDSSRKKNKLIFSIIPAAPVNLGQKQAVVSSINMAFYTGDPAKTNLSSVYFLPYTNFSTRSGFIITPNIWLPRNRWNLNGDLRIVKSSSYTYGVGGHTTKDDKDVVDFNYVRVYLNANYQVWGPVHAGLGYYLDYYYNVKDQQTGGPPGALNEWGLGTGTTTQASGISFNLLFDDRKNSINPEGGLYAGVTYRINPSFLPNDFSWNSLYMDLRKYFALSDTRHSVLGFWSLYWGCYGDVPYLCLPGTALDLSGRTGRGYVYGRYRGKEMLYEESEWRFDLSRNRFWGAVVFANVQSFTQPETGRFVYWLPAVGTGLRVKFNKRNDMNVTLDIAVGKNTFNWYLNLGEAF